MMWYFFIVAKVAIGQAELAMIVCGNVELKEQQLVTVFKPGGKRITKESNLEDVKEADVKGVTSQGVIGTPKELGIGESYYDEWVLPAEFEQHLGKPLKDVISGIDMPVTPPPKKQTSKKSKSLMQRKSPSMGLVDETQLLKQLDKQMSKALSNSEFRDASLNLNFSQGTRFGHTTSTVALKLAKTRRKPPKEIAESIVREIKRSNKISSHFNEISAHPSGFINFTFSDEFLVEQLILATKQGESYGASSVGKGKMVLVESPSINPNAAAHAGHLLNLFIGRSLMRLFEKVGFDTAADNVVHDHNLKICMAMWGIENLSNGTDPTSENTKSDHFVGKYYALAKEKYNVDPEAKAKIDQMLRDLENSDKNMLKLWKKVVTWAYSGHKETFDRLNEEQGHVWYESEYYTKGRDIIESNLGKGVVEKLPDGAVVSRLESYGLPDAVLLRSDGTSLYQTQDIYLTLQKIEKFDPWKAIWVVGNEQILHFQQLFALLDALGILNLDQVYHFAYGILVDKNGDRIGKGSEEAIADNMLDQMRNAAEKIMEQRKISVALDDKDKVSEQVGIGALRYALLSREPHRDVVYDPESALSLTGKSGPYIMYAYARGKSVIRKVQGEGDDSYGSGEFSDLKSSNIEIADCEKDLLLKLFSYPEIVLASANNYAPNILAEYLYDTARAFNNFYEKLTVAGAKGAQKAFRLLLTQLTTTVLKDGMMILGIEALEKM